MKKMIVSTSAISAFLLTPVFGTKCVDEGVKEADAILKPFALAVISETERL